LSDEAPFSDRVIEALDGGAAAVGERFVDERPKMFGGARGLWAGWNVGHCQVLGSVPAGIVDLKHDALVGSPTDRSGNR
jgi:hypothetical protein